MNTASLQVIQKGQIAVGFCYLVAYFTSYHLPLSEAFRLIIQL
ncbi:MAG: hypothetical protein ACI9MS_002505 [Glaciecola sp.]|jgi:hypothetical protein